LAYHGKYQSPTELVGDESLSRGEKIEMLRSWRDDKEAYLRATEEGMQGNDRSELLRQIENALNELEA